MQVDLNIKSNDFLKVNKAKQSVQTKLEVTDQTETDEIYRKRNRHENFQQISRNLLISLNIQHVFFYKIQETNTK